MRRAARTDETQTDIVEALRAAGAYVYPLKLPLDLLVGKNGATGLFEVKKMTGKIQPKPTKYTKLQIDFIREWKGGFVATVTDVDSALRALRTLESADQPANNGFIVSE